MEKPVIILSSSGLNSAIFTVWCVRSLQRFNYEPIEIVVGSSEEKKFIEDRLDGVSCEVSSARLGEFRGFSFKAFALSEYKVKHTGREVVVCDSDIIFYKDPTPIFEKYAGQFWFHKLYELDPADIDLPLDKVSESRWSARTLIHYRDEVGFDKRPSWILNSGLFLCGENIFPELARRWAKGIRALGPDKMLNDQSILTIAAAEMDLEPVIEKPLGYATARHFLSNMKELFIEEVVAKGLDEDNLRDLVKLETPAGRWSGGPLDIVKRAFRKLKRDLFAS
ncbi:hypothetical protein MNBD_NITROSPINAE04-1071 [hydrothermal vent metagenome]|uniref:Nucleotide-diphospho-sugar transferase domain-containing protein n=1 Tax=hydrothermal vent metagenome TaxID=652676 RepID=A0A3B1BZE7_9ZZZZ